jgi:hypothetical protein
MGSGVFAVGKSKKSEPSWYCRGSRTKMPS